MMPSPWAKATAGNVVGNVGPLIGLESPNGTHSTHQSWRHASMM